MNSETSIQPGLERVGQRAAIVGAVALLLCGIGAYSRPDEFYQSYLFAFVFWMGISIGCAEVLMLHHLVGGDWGLAIRRLLESASRTLWVMLVLFVPILLGLRHLYLWARPDEVLHSPELQAKELLSQCPLFSGPDGRLFYRLACVQPSPEQVVHRAGPDRRAVPHETVTITQRTRNCDLWPYGDLRLH